MQAHSSALPRRLARALGSISIYAEHVWAFRSFKDICQLALGRFRESTRIARDTVRAAYNYAEHLPKRRKMMQAWADYLDGLMQGSMVISLRVR